MKRLIATLAVILTALFITWPGHAQDAPNGRSLRVFLDCDRCDSQYIRQEIDFVNYVRDRADAQVHLLITTQSTGSGQEYTLNFIGRAAFAGVSDTLRYVSSNTDSDEERRAGLVQFIRAGLVRYLARTPQIRQLGIIFDTEAQAQQTTAEDDPWNFWVFRVGVDGSYEAEESTNEFEFGGFLNANRTTEQWKLGFGASGEYRESNFEIDDSTITSINRDGNAGASVIRSLGPHWGAGAFANISTSSFNNTDLAASLSATVEYNIFPYSESTRREFRINYSLDLRAYDYEEVTIFDQTSQFLLEHELEAQVEFQQPWGSAFVSLDGSNYLYDFGGGTTMLDFYSVEFDGFIEMRLMRGLSVFISPEVEWIKDQLYLPAEEASEEDILLRNRRLATSYQFEISLGLSYTFGSIYNNIVNARFGS